MRNIFIFLCIGSLWGCQTQESAYRMSIKDSLYRDDSLLAINVLQQLNSREKRDSVVGDSNASVAVQGTIKLFTLTKELRYGQEEVKEEVDSMPQKDSLAEVEEVKSPNTNVAVKPKPKVAASAATPKTTTTPKTVTTPAVLPTVKTPAAVSPAPAPSPTKPVEPAKVPSPPPAAAPVKQ